MGSFNYNSIIEELNSCVIEFNCDGERYTIVQIEKDGLTNKHILIAHGLTCHNRIFSIIDLNKIEYSNLIEEILNQGWYSMKLYHKRNDPLFKAIYEN